MKKYYIVGEYSEVSSGSTFDRPQWNELSEFCRQNKEKVDMIIFTSWDRFSRNIEDTLAQINLLKKEGIEVYAINSPVGYHDQANKILRSLQNTLLEIEDSE